MKLYAEIQFNVVLIFFLQVCTNIIIQQHRQHQHINQIKRIMDDPRRVEEAQRRKAGLYRRLGITRTPKPHPRIGGSRGYTVEMRQSEMWSHNLGLPIVASRRSIQRWNQRLHPFLMTGNRERNAIVGLEQYHLVLFLLAWPEARLDEIIAYLANTGTGIVYSRAQVSRRLEELGMTKKVGSTEARQASLPINLFKREQFWSMPLPFGVNGCERRRLLDIDECGIELQRTNRKYGHSFSGVRVVKPGHYSRDTKLTIILAVEAGDPALPAHIRGSVGNPRRWLRILLKAGTTTLDFNNFLVFICEDLQNNRPAGVDGDERRVFLWDNLSSHCSPIIHQTVEGEYGHRIIRRPPYKPSDAPIEYIFCQLVCELQSRTFQCNNLMDLIHAIQVVVTNLNGFDNTFNKLGY